MKKQELKQLTNDAFAHKSYISDYEGDAAITGKFALASYSGDGFWDVWLRNEADLAKGLGTRKLNNLISAIEAQVGPTAGPLRRLDGEAIYERMPTETFLSIAPLLGIRKRGKPPANPINQQARRAK